MAHALLRPRWLVLHLAVATVVPLFVGLGLWQLSRHAERQSHNELVAERAELDAEPLASVLAGGEEQGAYRRATATGTYRRADELLLTGRTLEGRPGHHVLTPHEGPDGVVVVDRGWVPFALDTPPVDEAAPPDEPVTVVGTLLPGERRAPLSGRQEGPALRLARVDLERIDAQVDGELAPLWLRLEDQTPGQPGALPIPVELPPLESGPHLAYAGQWFLFALIGLIGYAVLLRTHGGAPTGPAHSPDRGHSGVTADSSSTTR